MCHALMGADVDEDFCSMMLSGKIRVMIQHASATECEGREKMTEALNNLVWRGEGEVC